MYSLFILAALASVAFGQTYNSSSPADLTVETRTGVFVGNLNDTYPDVRQFKYIPYAKPPVGSKRWTYPEKLDDSTTKYDSTNFGPSCSQYVSAIPTAWSLNITGNLIVNYGESLMSGQVAQNSAEDCLSLAIWTPANASTNEGLPVILFMTGGGFVTGGVNIPTQLPANWVHRSQKHIVVTINYRVNILGFPNARGLKENNFGLQDQRMAVEWVAENIANFGGDPSKITLWGQSAGSRSTNMYLFAWANDPIVRASVSSSGVAIGRTSSNTDEAGTNFTFVSKSLGCDFSDAALELECMRRVPMPRIENFVGQYQDNATLVNASQPAITFTPVADGKHVFTQDQYQSLYSNGSVAQIPTILGTTAREYSTLISYPINNYTAGPYEAGVISGTVATVCATYNTSILREKAHLPTYRYQWAGNFTNISPVPWFGAYHYSDLYMFFGTYLIAPGEITDLEVQTSEKMQDLLYEFVADPTSLPANGWPTYEASSGNGGTLARFGADGEPLQLVDGNDVEGVCHIPGAVYDSTP